MQLTLFDSPRKAKEERPAHNGSDTSQAAAESVAPTAAGRRLVVYNAIIEAGDATIDELQQILGWPVQSICPRVNELANVKCGLIRDSGDRRPTRSGRNAKVWVPNH